MRKLYAHAPLYYQVGHGYSKYEPHPGIDDCTLLLDQEVRVPSPKSAATNISKEAYPFELYFLKNLIQ